MEILLTVSMSVPWLWYCTTVCKMLPLGELGKGHLGSFCIISYNCLEIYNHIKLKSLIEKLLEQHSILRQHHRSRFPLKCWNSKTAGFLPQDQSLSNYRRKKKKKKKKCRKGFKGSWCNRDYFETLCRDVFSTWERKQTGEAVGEYTLKELLGFCFCFSPGIA